MPILYVARIMVGTFSTDVWHVNNMTLGFGMFQGFVAVACSDRVQTPRHSGDKLQQGQQVFVCKQEFRSLRMNVQCVAYISLSVCLFPINQPNQCI